MSTDNEELSQPDELTLLKQRADMIGVKYHPSISLDKLREKVNAAVTPVEDKVGSTAESENQMRERLIREATELVRLRVVCMNPNKKEWHGEIFTVGNGVVGTHKKFVPFGLDEGYHVPRIIYNQIVERQCQVFISKKDGRGNTIKEGKMIKEFAVEVLPPLTEQELFELKQRQAMSHAID
jgi:hypothetical protein